MSYLLSRLCTRSFLNHLLIFLQALICVLHLFIHLTFADSLRRTARHPSNWPSKNPFLFGRQMKIHYHLTLLLASRKKCRLIKSWRGPFEICLGVWKEAQPHKRSSTAGQGPLPALTRTGSQSPECKGLGWEIFNSTVLSYNISRETSSHLSAWGARSARDILLSREEEARWEKPNKKPGLKALPTWDDVESGESEKAR